MEKNNSKPKRKFKKIKLGYIFAFIVIIAFIGLVLKLILPASGVNKYGDRLEGIKDHAFTDKEKKKIMKSLTEKEQVLSSNIDVEGKIINVIFTVSKDVSVEDSRNIANESVGQFSDKVKEYYDIQYMIKKKDEEGKKTIKPIDEEKTEEIVTYEFPIMGYKNKKSQGIVW